jgi:hypothetical protein
MPPSVQLKRRLEQEAGREQEQEQTSAREEEKRAGVQAHRKKAGPGGAEELAEWSRREQFLSQERPDHDCTFLCTISWSSDYRIVRLSFDPLCCGIPESNRLVIFFSKEKLGEPILVEEPV